MTANGCIYAVSSHKRNLFNFCTHRKGLEGKGDVFEGELRY